MRRIARQIVTAALVCAGARVYAAPATATALQVTLKSGFTVTCDHAESQGLKTKLYLHATSDDFMEVSTSDIVAQETVPVVVEAAAAPVPASPAATVAAKLDLHALTATAGQHNNLDADLIAAVVKQESAGNPHAVSRAGAQGLMQLMPGTAAQQGVSNSFDPSQNVEGGTAYLNGLLLKYHDNLGLALAAYNAGPAAVEKYHGIPPFRETQAYVARIIREFNRRKTELAREQQREAAHAATTLAAGLVR